MSALSLALLSAVVFATTNLDDFLVLLGFFSEARVHFWRIVAGQIIGVGLLVAASLVAAFVVIAISPAYVGFLGFVPLIIGVAKLWKRWVAGTAEGSPRLIGPETSKGSSVLTVAAVTIANGGDNIGVYTPLFATQTVWEISEIIIVFIALTMLWCLVAWLFLNHFVAAKPWRRYSQFVLPFALIALGCVILYRSGTIDLMDRWLGVGINRARKLLAESPSYQILTV